MTRLGIAQQRIEAAIKRIELVLNRRLTLDDSSKTQSELVASLEKVHHENKRLRDVNSEISSKLAGTIQRIERVLKD